MELVIEDKKVMTKQLIIIIVLLFYIGGNKVIAQPNEISDTIRITDFGVSPNSRVNVVLAVQKALNVCRTKNNPVLVFPQGRYDFWPQHAVEKNYYESNTTDNNPKCSGVFVERINNLTIDANGSFFIFHGKMQSFTIDHSSSFTLQNVNVNWDFPLTAQAVVIDTAKNHVDIHINKFKYPYLIEDGKLLFVGEGWKGKLKMIMEFNKKNHLIVPKTGDDAAFGKGWSNYIATNIGENIIRLTYNFKRMPTIGNVLVLRHSDRDHAGIFSFHSKDIHFENVNIHHCAGLGILSQFSENIMFNNVNLVPDKSEGRLFSGHDDGLHFSGCKGKISVENCHFAGLMDDPINVHGVYVIIMKKLTPNKVLCRFKESMTIGLNWGRPGEKVSFIDNKTLLSVGNGIVKSFVPINAYDFEISFLEDIPQEVQLNYGIENLTWTPEVVIQDSYFGSCRARGILVTTPKKVVIQRNIFESSGSAILIAGDVNYWYESGAVTDVLIRDNKFLESCLTSNYQFSEAVISIFPEIPEHSTNSSHYHRNIRIQENEFHMYDFPLLFAKSVDKLTFANNRINRSYAYKPFHRRKSTFTLIGCKNVMIKDNTFDNDVLGKNITLKYMSKDEIQLYNQKDLVYD